jgi:hypothetical protein
MNIVQRIAVGVLWIYLLGLCGRSGAPPWRAERLAPGRTSTLPLPPMGRLRRGRGAATGYASPGSERVGVVASSAVIARDFMDRKTVIILIASFGILFLVQTVVIPKFFPPIPVTPTNQLGVASSTASTNVPAPVATPSPAAVSPAPAIAISTNAPEEIEVLTSPSGEAIYTFTSRGGG